MTAAEGAVAMRITLALLGGYIWLVLWLGD